MTEKDRQGSANRPDYVDMEEVAKLRNIYSGGSVRRWHTTPTIGEQCNDAHQWGTAVLLNFIWPDAPKHVLVAALTHDTWEFITGDVPSPAKLYYPEIRKALTKVEGRLGKEFPLNLPLSDTEKAVLDVADILDAWVWATKQVKQGNEFYIQIRRDAPDLIKEYYPSLTDKAEAAHRSGPVGDLSDMTHRPIIYGAGLAGLVCAHVMRANNPIINEAQKTLPNNHAALLRFRTEDASVATGIPFKRVSVQKSVIGQSGHHEALTMRHQNMYADKVSGRVSGRSIADLDTCTRFIAPPDFIPRMAEGLSINLNAQLVMGQIRDNQADGVPMVSTIPMPMLMDIVEWKDKPEFSYKSVWTATYLIDDTLMDVDAYQTIYYPGFSLGYYRASLTGNKLIVEFSVQPDRERIDSILKHILWQGFGIDHDVWDNDIKVSHQKFGKLNPTDEKLRKQFILAMSDMYGIYSVGRFATWRQLLIDDIVKDAGIVRRFIDERSGYNRAIHNLGDSQ